jgi:hypothetical protein
MAERISYHAAIRRRATVEFGVQIRSELLCRDVQPMVTGAFSERGKSVVDICSLIG